MLSSTLSVPPLNSRPILDSLNRSTGVYASRCKKRLTLSWEISITSANRQQLGEFGSLNRNPMYIGKVQLAVEGRLIVLITVQSSIWQCSDLHILNPLSMRNSYPLENQGQTDPTG